MPSCTNSSSVSNQVPVALSLILPLSGSTAYNGALPPRCSRIWARVTQPLLVLFPADIIYSRDEPDEYRIDAGMLASHYGLAIGSFGDSLSLETTSLRARMLKTADFPRTVVILVLYDACKMVACPQQCRREPGLPAGCLISASPRKMCG